ncbi:MAG TPA: hypothetical protein VKA46_21610 [Gemmataceae bacterium]|nr:hypothetical protein [Gemmataceae bacterium]
MPLTSERIGTEQVEEGAKQSAQPRCPVCSGPLVELRSTLRCSRCYFSICEACAGEPGVNFASPSD